MPQELDVVCLGGGVAREKQVTDWSRDGRYLLFRTFKAGPTLDADIWALPLDGDGKSLPVLRTRFEERDAQFSRDGRWIAYHSNESGQHEVYVQPFHGPGERVAISTAGGCPVTTRLKLRLKLGVDLIETF